VKFNKGGLIARAGALLAFFSFGSPDSRAQQSHISPSRSPFHADPDFRLETMKHSIGACNMANRCPISWNR
jgi:hypothetical protein